MKKNLFVEIASAFFILLFVYTGLSKLYNPNGFRWALLDSPITSWATEFLVWAVPISELIISLLLFIPRSRKWGLYASASLLGIFTIYIGGMMLFTSHMPCSCGGIIQKMSWTQHLLFNLLSTGLAIAALRKFNQTNTTKAKRQSIQYT